jgi:hypothetical protein
MSRTKGTSSQCKIGMGIVIRTGGGVTHKYDILVHRSQWVVTAQKRATTVGGECTKILLFGKRLWALLQGLA